MSDLTHFNSSGEAHMVDVGGKPVTRRMALAEGSITMQPATFELIRSGNHKKGDVLGIARVAGIMAAKRTPDLIPLCHPIPITKVAVEFELSPLEVSPGDDHQARALVRCTARLETEGRTGIEIEALTAVQIALLTIYDMCKAVDRGMCIEHVRLVEKLGGQSGHWRRNDAKQP